MRYYRVQAFSNGFKVLDEVWKVCAASRRLISDYRMAGMFVRVRPVVN
jgi:hypothetical protein